MILCKRKNKSFAFFLILFIGGSLFFLKACPSRPPTPAAGQDPSEEPSTKAHKKEEKTDKKNQKNKPPKKKKRILDRFKAKAEDAKEDITDTEEEHSAKKPKSTIQKANLAFEKGLLEKAASILLPLINSSSQEKEKRKAKEDTKESIESELDRDDAQEKNRVKDSVKRRARILLARIRISQRQNKAAVSLLEKILLKNNQDSEAHALTARAWFLANKTGKALVHAQKAAKLASKNPDKQRLLGEILLRYQRPEAAEKALRKSLSLNPKSTWTLSLLGDSLWAQKRLNEAASAYKKGASQIQDGRAWQASVTDKLGTLLKAMKRKKEAKNLLSSCQKRFPKMGCPYTKAAFSSPDPTRPHRREMFVKPPKDRGKAY